MNKVSVAITPRDGFFCKDGRGWHTSASGRAHALDWPWPSTICGSLRTAWGKSREGQHQVFSPAEWLEATKDLRLRSIVALRSCSQLAEDPWRAEHRMWPAPLDALAVEGRSEFVALADQLQPQRFGTVGRKAGDEAAREALLFPVAVSNSKPLRSPRWFNDTDFVRWLCGERVSVPTTALDLARRVQSHVGINRNAQTAEDGILFAHDVVETLGESGEWAIGASVESAAGVPATSARLGADGRLASISTRVDGSMFSVPEELLGAFEQGPKGLRLIVTSPTLFSLSGWLPDGLEAHRCDYRGRLAGMDFDVVLRSACVGRPMHVSGWDLACKAPKKTDRMVPAGSVYFFERADGGAFRPDIARKMWLAALGDRTNEGFGTVVPGVWRLNGEQ